MVVISSKGWIYLFIDSCLTLCSPHLPPPPLLTSLLCSTSMAPLLPSCPPPAYSDINPAFTAPSNLLWLPAEVFKGTLFLTNFFPAFWIVIVVFSKCPLFKILQKSNQLILGDIPFDRSQQVCPVSSFTTSLPCQAHTAAERSESGS